MKKPSRRNIPGINVPRSFDDSTVASQFQGMEVEFDDKVNLFPVQVEKRRQRTRSNVRGLWG